MAARGPPWAHLRSPPRADRSPGGGCPARGPTHRIARVAVSRPTQIALGGSEAPRRLAPRPSARRSFGSFWRSTCNRLCEGAARSRCATWCRPLFRLSGKQRNPCGRPVSSMGMDRDPRHAGRDPATLGIGRQLDGVEPVRQPDAVRAAHGKRLGRRPPPDGRAARGRLPRSARRIRSRRRRRCCRTATSAGGGSSMARTSATPRWDNSSSRRR